MTQATMTRPGEKPVNANQPEAEAKYTTAQFILEQLKAWEVKRIYGVIGDATLGLLDELGKQDAIRYIPCRHEGAAALMASAEAKLTGKLAVCTATSGPGIANLINGLADAAADYAPVFAVTGQVDRAKIGTRTKQYIDQQKLAASVALPSELVTHPDALPELMEQALKEAFLQGKVAHLSIPKDLYPEKVKGEVKPYEAHLHQPLYASEQELDELAKLLSEADRPVLMIGRGVAAVCQHVKQLAESLSAAVVTSLPARPLFPNDHELYAGGIGQGGSEASAILLAESDCIVILGATWWPDEYVPTQARIIQVDMNRTAIGAGKALAKGVVGDLNHIVPELVTGERMKSKDRSGWKSRITEVTAGWKRQLEAEAAQGGTAIPPQRIISTIAKHAAENAVLAVDTGDHTLWFNRGFETKPGQEVLLSGRWRTLGFALPAAIAAKLTDPSRQVIAIAGDGGAVQTLLEFQTAVEQQLPIVLVIMNNSSYAMEKNRMVQAGLNPLGSVIQNPDFAKIAEACGGIGMKVDTADKLNDCLAQALRMDKPVLIDVVTAPTLVPHTQM
jgi:pyruvate oxidase